MVTMSVRAALALVPLAVFSSVPASASVWELKIAGYSEGTSYYVGLQEFCQTPQGILDVDPCQGAFVHERLPFSFTYWFDTDGGMSQTFSASVDPPSGWRYHFVDGNIALKDYSFVGTGIGSSADAGIGSVPFPGTGIPSYVSFEGGSVFTAQYLRTIEGIPPVPEPATWALLIAGFALIGGLARRRDSKRLLDSNYA